MTALGLALQRRASACPERVAIDPVTTPPVRYGGLVSEVADRVARFLGAWEPGRPAALAMDHGSEEVLTELALLEAGIPVLSLPTFFTQQQADHAISSCGARGLTEPSPVNDISGNRTAPSLTPRGTARITFTSGSTGNPKGICLSANHLLGVAKAVVAELGEEQAGRHLALLPPGILLETVAGMFATLLAGGTYVCPPQTLLGMVDPFRPDFAMLARAIADLRITSLILVPEYLAGLVAAMEAMELRLPLLTVVAVGGARTSPELIERARALGLPVRQGYGMTETGSVVALEAADGRDGIGSVGKPLGHVKVWIAEDGEVLLEGPLCLGSIGQEGPATPFATGDIGRIDALGRLWIEGRKSNLIVTSFGRNISPEWVEQELLAEPEIAQVMIWGDGLPTPHALLVAAHPEAELEAAVRAVNLRLPAYARITDWQEVAPFTPDNGQLSGNGKLRRQAIRDVWLDGQPSFFHLLEVATWRDRLRFLAIPQVRAGLSGAITKAAYIAYLTQAWHHVRHTVPLLQATRDHVRGRPEITTALNEYIAEESGHDEWILSDIAAAGGDAEAVRRSPPAPATAAMIAHAYHKIRTGNPVGFFGMVYVLESVSVALAQRGASAVAHNLGLPPEAFTYLTSHGSLDQDHMRFFAELVNGLTEQDDLAAITAMAKDMFGLFGAVFATIPLEGLHAAA
jgi:acyl-CoA synthetase (AMP-forming)/AMP-acid ligase II/pyrroloquinoline quinone (PQQ) biosynthesis protein C